MGKTPSDPNDPQFWLIKGAQKTADFLITKADYVVQAVNALLKIFIGMPRKIAGGIVSTSIQAAKAATLRSQGIEPGDGDGRDIPVNPYLYPEGRTGRRFRYKIVLKFQPLDGDNPNLRTVFVDYPGYVLQKIAEERAIELAAATLSQSPTGKGLLDDLSDYDISANTINIYRSH